ncbi:unnamed protein product, partial [Mesorhabditis belari]|uniref:Thioredoxin domain-containing protein n=1 Tax=Mesorhabditis belari TaxID=2138241 RepID=A0AAF3EYT5_9BILA
MREEDQEEETEETSIEEEEQEEQQEQQEEEQEEEKSINEFAEEIVENCIEEALDEAITSLEIQDYWLNEEKSEEEESNSPPKTGIFRKEMIWRIFIALIVVYPSIFYVWSGGTTKTRQPYPPRPFFSNFSRQYVADFHSGDATAERLSSHNKITIVMYYAPWDRFSAAMRRPFEFVAREFVNEPQVRFVAINCFALAGECRRTYRLFSYPIIMAHAGASAISVYQGEYSADHFYRWVEDLLYPFDFLIDSQDIEQFVEKNLFSIIGYFPQNGKFPTSDLRRYLACAFQSNTGQRNRQDARFGVITNQKLAQSLDLSEGLPIVMKIREAAIMFHDEITSERIEEWLRENAKHDSALHWLTINKHNDLSSTYLDNLLTKFPTILLFDQQKPLAENELLKTFSEIAEEYWDCNQNTRVPIVQEIEPIDCQHSLTSKLTKDCCEMSWNEIQMKALCNGLRTCSSTNSPEKCSEKLTMWSKPSVETCPIIADVETVEILKICCEERFVKEEDPRLPEALWEERKKRREIASAMVCSRKRTHRKSKYKMKISSSSTDPLENLSVKSFACSYKNNTLQFGFIDSKHYSFFAQKWGLKTFLPTLMAIDSQQELFAVLEGVNKTNIRRFIIDFHDKVLDDYYLTEERRKSAFSHEAPKLEETIPGRSVLIERLTELTFRGAVENKTKIDTIVYFSGGSWHGASMVNLHIFHSISRIFLPAAQGLVRFYMIDTSRNELPYNYNFETYPAIVVFNGHSDDLSWKFPEDAPITVPNLFSFILSRCSHQLRLKIAFELLDRVSTPRALRRLNRHIHWLKTRIRSLRESQRQLKQLHHDPLHAHHNEVVLKKHVIQLRAARSMISAIQAERLTSNSSLFQIESLRASDLLTSIKMLPSLD